ncbi:MAG: ABC transporter substrate-binding protein [Butyrivibrio sp.]|nr:ABC transporter substrate-binding protein [Butyrivibrio sp.]
MGIVMLLCGCRPFSGLTVSDVNTEDGTETMSNDSLISVGFSQLGSESTWRSANTESVKAALSTGNGFFLIFDNARQKQEKQFKAVRGFISQRVDYIVICPVIQDGWDVVLSEAKDAGIPVILLDRYISVADESLYTTFIGEDMYAEGASAGKWLESYLEEEGIAGEDINIVVLEGTSGSSAQAGRTKGFGAIAARHMNWNMLASANGEFTQAKGKETMARLLHEFDDIDIIVCQNDDMAFGALEALNEAGIKTGGKGEKVLISFDGTKQALELVEQGVINVDIECNPNSGDLLSKVISDLEDGNPIEKTYYMDEKVFTKENVSEYIEDRNY